MKHICYIVTAFLLFSCKDTEEPIGMASEAPDINYFLPGTFSSDSKLDSALGKNFSESFLKAGEKSLTAVDSTQAKVIRVYVRSNFFNDYCISLEKKDTVYKISLFIDSDKGNIHRVGISGLKLTYESTHPAMRARWSAIESIINGGAFDWGYDNLESAVDGTRFLIEYRNGSSYSSSFRWSGGEFLKKPESTLFLDEIHKVIPDGFVVRDLKQIKDLDDFLFAPLSE